MPRKYTGEWGMECDSFQIYIFKLESVMMDSVKLSLKRLLVHFFTSSPKDPITPITD